jgi:hypothetical protein
MTLPAGVAQPGAGRSRWPEALLTTLALAVIGSFYFWTVRSAGGLGAPKVDDYYHLLVEGFRQGHLYLPNAPRPDLMALADPYDPAQNHAVRMPDASYFRGHYYLYFGATPAVTLMWPFEAITGRGMSTGTAVLVFVLVGFAALGGVWLALRRRYFPGSSPWIAALGVIMLGLGTHVLALARRPAFWELSIASGFAWTMLALAAVYAGLHGRRPVLAFGLAGLCLGLAAGARPPCLLGAAMLAAPLWYLGRQGPSSRVAWRCAWSAAIPLGVCIGAILTYNYARFGRPLEFGQSYQLTGIYEAKARHFSLCYALPNLAIYGFTLPRWSWEFPFLSAPRTGSATPGYFGGEEICGLAVTLPILWLAVAVPLAWRKRASAEAGPLRAMIGAVAGTTVAVGGLILCYFSATERYMAEFTPALALLAVVGLLALERQISTPVWRRAVPLLAGAAGAITAVLGILISFDYHSQLLRNTDPKAWSRLAAVSSQAVDRLALWLGASQGPVTFRVRFRPQPAGTTEMLMQAGRPPSTESVLVEYQDAGQLRLGWVRMGSPPLWSQVLDYDAHRFYDVRVQMGTLYRPLEPLPTAGFRATLAFRERTGVALWFDGRHVLSTITGTNSGGPATVVMNRTGFRGELRRSGTNVLQLEDLLRETAANWVLAGPPPADPGRDVPLLSWGRKGAGDTLALRRTRPDAARLAYVHWGEAERTSPEFPLNHDRAITIEVEHEPRWPWAEPTATTRPLIVWADDRIVWQTHVPVYPCRENEVVVGRNTVGTGNCDATAPGWQVAPPPLPPPPGGTLRLRLIAPPGPVGESGPLLELGQRPGAADLLSLQYCGNNLVRFRFDHWGAPLLEGEPKRLSSDQVHVVEITIPSCAKGALGIAKTGEVRVRLDGEDALQAVRACVEFAPDEWAVGRNDVGATTCEPAFSGWILDARWVATNDPG